MKKIILSFLTLACFATAANAQVSIAPEIVCKQIGIAKNMQPSARGEYEITDVNKEYLKQGKLKVGIMNRGTAWLDTGTFDSFADACEFVRVIEKRQSQKVGCIEEVAYRMGYINHEQLMQLADKYAKSGYGEYLRRIRL